MILQLNPPLPMVTPKGKGWAHFLIDYGPESNLYWVCFLDDNGECWTFDNTEVRVQRNVTLGRCHVSPFYDPDVVNFLKREGENESR